MSCPRCGDPRTPKTFLRRNARALVSIAAVAAVAAALAGVALASHGSARPSTPRASIAR